MSRAVNSPHGVELLFNQLADVIGSRKAMCLFVELAGKTVRMPKRARYDSAIAAIVGSTALSLLCASFGGLTIRIPVTFANAHARISAKSGSCRAVARRFGVTSDYVRHVRNAGRDFS